LSALQKRYGLVVVNDASTSAAVEPMETLMLRNRALAKENAVLRQQLIQQKDNSALLSTHQELMDRLYECVATIESLSMENANLRRELSMESEKSAHGSPQAENTKHTQSDQWAHRCTALQQRLEELVEQQIEERTQHSSAVLTLKNECSTTREQLAQQTSRANSLAQQVAEVRAISITNEGGVVHAARLLTKDNASQTSWTGSGTVDDQAQCQNDACKDLARHVDALTLRLGAATRLLKS
jgi:chromosome segregation ATPase